MLHEATLVELASAGQSLAEVTRSIGVSAFTYCCWRKEFDGLKTDHEKRLKENERLRKAVSNLSLEMLILREGASGVKGSRKRFCGPFQP